MNSESASSEHQELVDELRRRFPLLDQIVGQFGEHSQEERIPWFLALFLSAATKREPGACCFVMDKTPGTATVAAVILALARLQDEFPELVKNYAESALDLGQRVRVKPDDYVYEYAGIREEYPNLFKLRILGDETCSCSLPLEDVLRLEPTKRKQKKGKQSSDLGKFEPNQLDRLLNLTTCGNNSIFRNSVLLYSAQARFLKLINSITLAPEKNNGFSPLSDYLPWGTVGQEGELKPIDTYQVSGEPIVAVTKVLEDLALASSSAPMGSKIVFVDGASGLARNLQAFDDIADHQRVVILASFEETEALDELQKRDCPIWYMSPEAILIGESSIENRTRSTFVGATIQAANTRQRVEVNVVICHDNALQTVAESLESVASRIKIGDAVQESEEILSRLYGILLECSECSFGVGEEITRKLHEVSNKIEQTEKWQDPAIFSELKNAIYELEKTIESGKFGEEKTEEMLKLGDHGHEEWAVVAKSLRTAKNLAMKLNDWGISVPVLPVSKITSDCDFAGIILPAWPNARYFYQLKGKAVTPNIRVLAYPFETKWVSHYQAQKRNRELSNRMDVQTLSRVLGIEPHLLEFLSPAPPESPPAPPESPPIIKIYNRVTQQSAISPKIAAEGEDSHKARYVRFTGNCYALLTEWAELPKLNKLIVGTNAKEVKLETETVDKLFPGDFVLFRDSGDKEILRILAEDRLGVETYERIRTVAERWKSSLDHLGTSPSDIQRRLAVLGLSRTTATIGGWLGNPDRIGPGDFRDIEFIAKAAGDAELLSKRSDIEEAITCIRGAHISAGGQLTQLLLSELGKGMSQVDEQPTLLDFDFGAAWVVHVQMIDYEQNEYPSNLVNRLLWNDDIDL